MQNLKIYTYNVLNPDINVSSILFRKIIDDNFKVIIDKSKEIAKIDLIRWAYRKKMLLNIINLWLKSDAIICLQEVSKDLLTELKKKYKNISYTKTCDKIMLLGKFLNKDEYRVIITSKNIKITESKEIEIKNDIMQKNALYIKGKFYENNIQCINLHMHWKNNAYDMNTFINTINKNLTDDLFIICGDYNKSINSDYMKPFISNIKIDNIIDLKNNKDKFTSFSLIKDKSNINIDKNIEGSYIDYLILGNTKSCNCKFNKIEIINKINNNTLLYKLSRILDIINIDAINKNMDKSKIKKYAKKWSDINKKSKICDISDHKPVSIEIKFNKYTK